MPVEFGFTLREAIESAYISITEPWAKADLPLPSATVKELAREAHLPQGTIIEAVLQSSESLGMSLVDLVGKRVNGNVRQAAIDSAPLKRVARETQKGGHAFEEVCFRFGRGRLRIIHYSSAA